jgi:GH15 family glucan-1,4-alpha-glucosidase
MASTLEGSRLLDDPFVRRSIAVLRQGQSPRGALVASPNFSVYRYAWLRDGAFCAHALDQVGERGAASAFHRFVAESIEAHRSLFDPARFESSPPERPPPARYTLDGTLEEDGDEPWPNFQVDGYGMWLWALESHLAGGGPPAELIPAIELTARYLRAAWRFKCFNCWEEFDEGEHASTLGAVVAGLEAAARLLDDGASADAAQTVRAELLDRYVGDKGFRRSPRDDRVDGSLLWLSTPFRVLPPEDPRVAATIDSVRRDLAGPGGGIYRYRGDTYYGGGQWLLLTSSLAWHDALVGNTEAQEAGQAWVRRQATHGGDLPEQVTAETQEPAMVEPWVNRWGPVASPLLWSHAMYLIAETAGA